MQTGIPFSNDLREFVASTQWTFAKTYTATWPHEYAAQTPATAPMILALARHILEHGTDGRFYSQVRKYHDEDGMVYWAMSVTADGATGAARTRSTRRGWRRSSLSVLRQCCGRWFCSSHSRADL